MDSTHLTREELEPYWMPFTGNRQFKADPRMIVAAEGVFLVDDSGRRVLDGLSGLWCCGVGHNRREITEAVNVQLQTLDYAPAFQFGHPGAFALANRLKSITPAGLDYAFFTNSGSETVDTALKMARAYWRLRGKSGKTRPVLPVVIFGRSTSGTGTFLREPIFLMRFRRSVRSKKTMPPSSFTSSQFSVAASSSLIPVVANISSSNR